MSARRWIALLCFVAIGAGVAWVVRERRELVQRALELELARLGFLDPRVRVAGVGLHGALLRDVSLGPEAQVAADRVDLAWSAESLRARRLLRVDVEGLRVRAAYGERFSVGVSEPAGATGGGPLLPLPFAAARLTDAEIVVVTPNAALRSRGDGEYVDGVMQLHATSQPFAVMREDGGKLRVPALTVDAEARADPTPLGFALTLRDSERRVALHVEGVADLEAPTVEAALRLEPVRFAEGGFQPAQLMPELVELLRDVTGRVMGEGALRWETGVLTSHFDLTLADVAATLPFGRVSGLRTQLRMVGPWPPELSGSQHVELESIDVGVVLTDGDVRYRLGRDAVLDIERASCRFAGGTLSTRGRVDLSADEQRLVLRARGIDLAQLLASVALEGLSGEGTLDGEIPVVRRGARVELQSGRIAARRGSGVIRYQAPRNVAAMVSGKQGFDVVLAALRDFHYEELSATLDGDALSDVRLVFQLNGRNPEYQNGRPVRFTLNLEAPFLALLRGTAASILVPQLIERRLGERAGGAR